MKTIPMKPNETIQQYKNRVYAEKELDANMTWADVAAIINAELHLNRTPDAYRSNYRNYKGSVERITPEIMYTMIRDEERQINADVRRLSREESILEIARYATDKLNERLPLLPKKTVTKTESDNIGTLLLSDWHYGSDFSNYWNTYNPELCIQRLDQLRAELIPFLKQYHISTLNIVNLGDLISGRIHAQLRISARYDVLTQILDASELLIEFIDSIEPYVDKIEYYDCADNHSRLEPDLTQHIELETLTRITHRMVLSRFKNNEKIHVNENEIDPDIISFKVFDYTFIGVHGNKNSDKQLVEQIRRMMHPTNIDCIVAAHFHHFDAGDQDQICRVINGSLMGTDTYAKNKWLKAYPSQTLIVSNKSNPMHGLHCIRLT